MIRQLDTTIGLTVGGVIGWYHHKWYIWAFLLLIMILWHFLEIKTEIKQESKR